VYHADGDAARVLPVEVIDSLQSMPDDNKVPDVSDEAIRLLSAWLIAAPYEVRKCRRISSVLSCVAQVIRPALTLTGAMEERDQSQAGAVAVSSVAVPVVLRGLLRRTDAAAVASRAATNIIKTAGIKKADKLKILIPETGLEAATVEVHLAQGFNSAADRQTASNASLAAVRALQRTIVRQVPMGATSPRIQHLIGRGGRGVSVLCQSLKSMSKEILSCCGLDSRLGLQVCGTHVTAALFAVPTPRLRVEHVCEERVRNALAKIGDEMSQRIRTWLATTTAVFLFNERASISRQAQKQSRPQIQPPPSCLKELREKKRLRDATRSARHSSRRMYRERSRQSLPRHRHGRGGASPPTTRGLLAFEEALDCSRRSSIGFEGME